jgi:hypothetical protein
MANWKKVAWVSGISAASLTGLFFLGRAAYNGYVNLAELKNLSKRLVTVITARIHALDSSGLTVSIDVTLKNTSARGFRMGLPFVSIVYGGKTVASSEAADTRFSIPPKGEYTIRGIMLNVPFSGFLTVAGALIRSLTFGSEVKLKVQTTTSIDPLWAVDPVTKKWTPLKDFGIERLHDIPYQDVQELTIKKAK